MKKILLLLLMLVSVNLAQAIVVTPALEITTNAQEEGEEVNEPAVATVEVPGKSTESYETPAPEITTNLTFDALVITATGEGDVTLYVQYIDMETGDLTTESYEGNGTVTHEIPRDEEDYFINYWATAQANEDAEPGTTEVEYFVKVPGIKVIEPIDHGSGCWVVLKDKNGNDVWHKMDNYRATAQLYYSVYGDFNPDTDERPLVPIHIVIDGISFGAPSANTEVDMGNVNPLIEGDNCYLIPVGYKFIIGVNNDYTGLYLYAINVGSIEVFEATPTPEITTDLTKNYLVITATGEGDVNLYVQYIDNMTGAMTTKTYEGEGTVTVVVPRGEENAYINYWAIAQANENAEPSITEVTYFVEVPAKVIEPTDPHESGYWVVLRDRHGREVWQEFFLNYGDYTTVIRLKYSVYGGYNPETEERPLVPIHIVIDGIKYGAPSANTEVYLGSTLDNPLVEGGNFYLLTVGTVYNIGVAQAQTGEKYLYAAVAGYPNPGAYEDPTEFITGDADGNAKVTIADVTTMIDYLLNGYSTGMNMDNADVDGSGKVTIEDVTLLIDYLLKGTWW